MAITLCAIFRNEMRLPVKLRKGVDRFISNENYVSAVTTVTTTWSAARKKCLSNESHESMSTVSGAHFYYCRI
jgi:hypothetical protein